MNNKLLLLELNELCPSLLDKWMKSGELPNFSKFYNQSDIFITKADAPPPNLNPWTQWFSLHTGVNFSSHGVVRLTDGPKSSHKDIWSYFIEKGLSVGNFSSMNCKAFAGGDNFYMPDPWTQTEKPFPEKLRYLNDFVANNVQNHSINKQSSWSVVKSFLIFYCSHGFSLKTVFGIIKQLLSEKLKKGKYWKRAFALDWITSDVFFSLIRDKKPHFATFFSNSVAHMQHAYWRQHDPDAFSNKPSEEQIKTYGSAILDSYKNLDKMLEGFFKLEEKYGYHLVLVSALSQQPFTKYEAQGGQNFYRLMDAEKFIAGFGFEEVLVLPTMTHQFRVRCNIEGQASKLKKTLESINLNDNEKLFYCHLDNEKEVYFACGITRALDLTGNVVINNKKLVLSELFTQIEGSKSGCHHEDGVAWFKTGTNKIHKDSISIVDIFPTLCEHLKIEIKDNIEGKSVFKSLSNGIK